MTPSLIEIGAAKRTLPGEAECGDRYVVKHDATRALLGVIDGVGHGPEAARAAKQAAAVLEASSDESVGVLLRRCHEVLQGTRGAAITLIAFDDANQSIEWVGAGNVTAVLLRSTPFGTLRCRELFVRSGVAGARLPSVVSSAAQMLRGDFVVVATDGMNRHFIDGIRRSEPPQRMAERLLTQYQTQRDDALIVVARVAGSER